MDNIREVEVILFEQISLIIAMLAFLLSIVIFIINLFEVGIKNAFSLKPKLAKIALGLLGTYALFLVIFLVTAN